MSQPAAVRDTDFLALTVARTPIAAMDKALQTVLSRIAAGRFIRSIGKLIVPFGEGRSPLPGGAHPISLVAYEPRAAPETCVLIANLQDGWSSLSHLVAKEHGQFQLQVISTADADLYPKHFMQIWRDGEVSRIVQAMRDEPHWFFLRRVSPNRLRKLSGMGSRARALGSTEKSFCNTCCVQVGTSPKVIFGNQAGMQPGIGSRQTNRMSEYG